jgi:glycosyltransferase involved in cell wall biosynthesis
MCESYINISDLTLSIVTPIYKDSYLAYDFVKAVCGLNFPDGINLHEIIFVIDGGGKQDDEEIENIAKKIDKVKMISFSRNFGQHIAISAGYAFASGDLICMINVDQQDPPEEIITLLPYILTNDYDIVYGMRQNRRDSYFKRLSSKLFNILLNKLTGCDVPLNVATIRIMTRKFIDNYNYLTEKSRYLPGLENWLGFPKLYVPTNHKARKDNLSSYNFKKRLLMAIESIVSFSDLPLRWIATLGFVFAIIGLVSIITLIFLKLFLVTYQSGYISIVSLIVFMSGIQMIVIGVSSIYIGRVLREVQNRPLYIIKNTKNF